MSTRRSSTRSARTTSAPTRSSSSRQPGPHMPSTRSPGDTRRAAAIPEVTTPPIASMPRPANFSSVSTTGRPELFVTNRTRSPASWRSQTASADPGTPSVPRQTTPSRSSAHAMADPVGLRPPRWAVSATGPRDHPDPPGPGPHGSGPTPTRRTLPGRWPERRQWVWE